MRSFINRLAFAPAFATCAIIVVLGGRSSSAVEPSANAHSAASRPPAAAADLPPAWNEAPEKHPLATALRWAKEVLPQIDRVDDYTATLIKQERIDGKMRKESLFIKVRHRPLAIYAKSLAP